MNNNIAFLAAFMFSLATACDGGTATTNTSKSESAQPIAVNVPNSGFVPPCPSGYGHPNVCCLGSPSAATRCTESAGPFISCAADWLTFPNPTQCCPLNGTGSCIAPQAPTITDAGSSSDCRYLCGPGGFLPSVIDASADELVCCEGSGPIFRCASKACSHPGNVCIPDGGACADPSPGPCLPQCGACPPGWEIPANGQYDLCCRQTGGTTACFSQAQHVGP